MTQKLLKEFFPLLPNYLLPMPLLPKITSHQIAMAPITKEKITRADFLAALFKRPGPDTIPMLV